MPASSPGKAPGPDQLDLIAFVGTFVVGLIVYITLHLILQVSQLYVTAAIVVVLVAYAFVVSSIPRLRVRLDQAGDNAYYLGLLFTLISMAVALVKFGVATESENPNAGIDQIIANFGIALASTITGIFLRVTLHQMRVDPADVEDMTRIELAEASKRIRATLDLVTAELGSFHDEVRQRSSDVLNHLLDSAKATVTVLNAAVERSATDMLTAVAAAHTQMLQQAHELTRVLGVTAAEAVGAAERLRAIEPPPVTLSRRLDKVTSALGAAAEKTDGLVQQLQETADAASTAMREFTKASTSLAEVAGQLAATHNAAATSLATSVANVGTALDTVGRRLEQDHQLLSVLEEQSRRAAQESVRAQEGAVEVLTSLTQLARGLTVVLSERETKRVP